MLQDIRRNIIVIHLLNANPQFQFKVLWFISLSFKMTTPGRKRGRPRKIESQETNPPEEDVDIRPMEPVPTFAPINYKDLERAIDNAKCIIRRYRTD